MAAAFTTTSTSLEGQILELARELQELELAEPADERPNRIGIAPDFEGLEVTITVTLPITLSGSGNNLTFSADTYL